MIIAHGKTAKLSERAVSESKMPPEENADRKSADSYGGIFFREQRVTNPRFQECQVRKVNTEYPSLQVLSSGKCLQFP